ncbi:hypothetical protein V498_06797 [Pseudogymnoascus sp. VKM F-4517 (FW-2822)]|nr:hypothetical protein V498_06797 [Pseudogymnoascus sp. VKM F-4517 (FW-2822)]
MPPKTQRVVVERAGGGRRVGGAQKGYLGQAYEAVTSSENASVVRSIAVFGAVRLCNAMRGTGRKGRNGKERWTNMAREGTMVVVTMAKKTEGANATSNGVYDMLCWDNQSTNKQTTSGHSITTNSNHRRPPHTRPLSPLKPPAPPTSPSPPPSSNAPTSPPSSPPPLPHLPPLSRLPLLPLPLRLMPISSNTTNTTNTVIRPTIASTTFQSLFPDSIEVGACFEGLGGGLSGYGDAVVWGLLLSLVALLLLGPALRRRLRRQQRPELRQRDEEGYGALAQDGDELERQVGGLGGEVREEGVEEVGGEARGVRARGHVRFDDGEGEEAQPAPVDAELEVSSQAEDVHDDGAGAVVLEDLYGADGEVVADRGAVCPSRDGGAEAVVGEASGGVEEGVLCGLEVAEEVGGGCALGDFVGVVERGEAAEAGFDFAVAGAVGDAQVLVVVGGLADGVVRFVDGVEEVGGYHGDVDALAVLGVEG